MDTELTPRHTPGASVTTLESGWRMEIPAGAAGAYRLAQLDDYTHLPRCRFRHSPPRTLHLRARLSAQNLPGTWGFGLWNDPFGLSIGFGGAVGRLPALPNAAWFFHASPPNYLSFQNNLPAQGFFAGTFRSPRIPPLLLTPGLFALPLLALRPASRLLRRLTSRLIRQDAAAIAVDVTQWHEYSLSWLYEECVYSVDGTETLQTPLPPSPPLSLVLWIDNQYAAWTPEGYIKYGTLENQRAWMEIACLTIE